MVQIIVPNLTVITTETTHSSENNSIIITGITHVTDIIPVSLMLPKRLSLIFLTDISHFPLSCSNYSDERSTLQSKIRNISFNILENTNSQITHFFLYGGDKDFTVSNNFAIFNSVIEYVLATKRFDKPLPL